MIKHLILQQLYDLSDPQLELQVADRISFRVFLGTTEVIPDYTTVWLFRERLIKSGKLEAVWEEFLNQLSAKGYEVKNGVIQDATFITSDPGAFLFTSLSIAVFKNPRLFLAFEA
jgi:transposase, IS5 family